MSVGGDRGLPPAWLSGGIEKPAGEKDMGGWTALYYTEVVMGRVL